MSALFGVISTRPSMLAAFLGVAAIIVTNHSAAQTELYRWCAGPDRERLTRDKHDIRVGEQCIPVSREERARMKAEAARPPTSEEKVKMTSRAQSMDFWCGELGVCCGSLLRRPKASTGRAL
jgi:hypothetical protein